MKRKEKGKQKAARRQAEEATRRTQKNGPEMKQAQAVGREPLLQPPIRQEYASPIPISPKYRGLRAAKGNKKYINVLVDAELQMEVRVRMTTRKLTWNSLVESLFRGWLEENPEFRPNPDDPASG